MERLRVIDSHTGGEPTRVVVEGLPDLGTGPMPERVARLAKEFDRYRTAVIGEPRSSPVTVGAYLMPSEVADFGVVFFNPARYLGMCGHGTIGLLATLSYLRQIDPGPVSLETPVGIVNAVLHEDGKVSFDNVPAFRYRKDVEVAGVRGDVAFGGNWFFICSDHGQTLEQANIPHLLEYTQNIRRSLADAGITGENGAEIDHVDLFGPSEIADSRNFVLCPGGEYDRSPCGTGTCAKLACLVEDGKLAATGVWRQESIIGSVFEGRARRVDGKIVPNVTGRAFVNGESILIFDDNDPFAWGIG